MTSQNQQRFWGKTKHFSLHHTYYLFLLPFIPFLLLILLILLLCNILLGLDHLFYSTKVAAVSFLSSFVLLLMHYCINYFKHHLITQIRYYGSSRIMPYFSHGGIGRHKPRAIDSSVHVTDVYLTSIIYIILYLIRLTSVKVVSVQSRFPLKINI